jgi:hypothetical protein
MSNISKDSDKLENMSLFEMTQITPPIIDCAFNWPPQTLIVMLVRIPKAKETLLEVRPTVELEQGNGNRQLQ